MILSSEEHYRLQLESLILKHSVIMSILKRLCSVEPSAYIAAGIIRNTVWAYLHGVEYNLNATEIDVIFHDDLEQAQHRSNDIITAMSEQFPQMQWDVTNQATVHHWYRKDNGECIAPLQSIEHALSIWPETATAVAVRLMPYDESIQDQLEIVSPFGLSDLFELRLRWNPTLVSYEGFIKRLKQKQMMSRWPKLELIDSHIENKRDRD